MGIWLWLIVMGDFSRKQKRAFHCIKTGIDIARRFNQRIRFLTLSTSRIQMDNTDYSKLKLNDSFRRLKQIIRRTKVIDLVMLGYIANDGLRKYYPNKKLGDSLIFDYFRVRTNEGNGVLHILFKGDYIPYNYLVDIWNDVHNSWNIDIKEVKVNRESALKTSCYVVTQYLSNQDSSYQRSSKSWKWAIRDYYKRFYEYIIECKTRYYYNPVQSKFYKNNTEIDIFKIWVERLVSLLKPPPPKQLRLVVL
jgi:hypothetical protein